jgi:hypothetical protein
MYNLPHQFHIVFSHVNYLKKYLNKNFKREGINESTPNLPWKIITIKLMKILLNIIFFG